MEWSELEQVRNVRAVCIWCSSFLFIARRPLIVIDFGTLPAAAGERETEWRWRTTCEWRHYCRRRRREPARLET